MFSVQSLDEKLEHLISAFHLFPQIQYCFPDDFEKDKGLLFVLIFEEMSKESA